MSTAQAQTLHIPDNDPPTRLARRLGLFDAVVMGLAAMIGAGIFAAVGPAAAVAGSGLMIGVLIAGGVAFLNATTMAQLAAIYPESGGTYVYGRKRLGEVWGFLAGWGFVVGKLASCSAMALTFAHYAFPSQARAVAGTAVLALTLINTLGIKKTAWVTRLLIALVLLALSVVVFAALAGGGADPSRLAFSLHARDISGILESAGIMFFAFAGYARIATLGEEVLEPHKNIPRAILISLGLTLGLYLLVVTTALLCVDVDRLANSKAPLTLAVASGRYVFLAPVVRVGAALASLGVLLSLLAGVSRTVFAMASNRDLPKVLSAVHARYNTPARAELLVGAIVLSLVVLVDVGSAIGLSSFAVLIYYAIAHVSAWTLPAHERRWPRGLIAAGLVSCLTIALSLPQGAILGGMLGLGLGFLGWCLFRGKGRKET